MPKNGKRVGITFAADFTTVGAGTKYAPDGDTERFLGDILGGERDLLPSVPRYTVQAFLRDFRGGKKRFYTGFTRNFRRF